MATDVSTPLPDITLSPGTRITISSGDAGVVVTKLAIKVFQVTPVDPASPSPRPLLLRSGR